MRLIVTENASMIADVTCDREAVYIGSGPDCKVQLNDARLAVQHAVVFPEKDKSWALNLLDDHIIVQINGMRVTEKVTLRTGDEISLLDFVIRVFPATETVAAAIAAAPRPTSVARLTQFVQAQLPPGATTRRYEDPVTVPQGQMARLHAIAERLSQADTVETLMDHALQSLLEAFAAQRAWIGVRRVNYGPMEYVEGRTLAGQSFELPELAENLKPRILDRAQFILVPRVSHELPLSVLAGPLVAPETLLGFVYLDSGDTGRFFEQRDLEMFGVVLTVVAAQLDAILKQIAKNRAAMIAGEVGVAHAIQARLTPRKLPQWPELQWGAFREPGSERTGNVYDIVRLSNNLALFMVAHTTSTGPWPSMLMAQAQAALRMAGMHQDAPHICLRSLNWLLFDGLKDHPLDCFVGALDPANGQLRYSVAGALGAYIIGQRGDERSLLVGAPQPQLADSRTVEYPLLSEQLESGETLVLFTPGVTTARNRAGEIFGQERFINILCDAFGQQASGMLKDMLTDLRAFTVGGSQPDDVTVVLAHRV
jgi:sigma-B regulation protein RsbU (phosphoserine phosphatase)